MALRTAVAATILAACLSGCATTRAISFGALPGGQMLVTLVVSEDREFIAQECRQVLTTRPILGCQASWPVPSAHEGLTVRAVRIVRYTDALPSELAFEIDAHELCHAVAALQVLEDPCHQGNGGMVRAADARGVTALH